MAPVSSAPGSPWPWRRLLRRRGPDARRSPQRVHPVTSNQGAALGRERPAPFPRRPPSISVPPLPTASEGHDAWQEPLRAGAVAAWVRRRADQHLTEVEHAVRRLRQQAATEVAGARVESDRLRRVAADHATEIVDEARNEAVSLRTRTDDEARRRLAEVELQVAQWLHETEAEAAVIVARAEARALTIVTAAEAERDAIVAAATQERAALLTDARVRAEQDLNTVLGLIEALLAEAEEETSERRRLACLAADEIIAAARSEAARVAAGAQPGPANGGTDEVAARRLRTEQDSHRRIS